MNSTPQVVAAEAAGANAPTQESPFAQVAHALAERGYSVVPIMPGSKCPGRYAMGRWVRMTGWDDLATAPMDPQAIEEAATWPDAGIGVVLGGAGGLLCVDVDTDDAEIVAAIAGALGDLLLVKRRGSKGFGALLRQPLGAKITSRSWRVGGATVLDLLSSGRQVVLPPTVHPSTQQPYRWVAPEFALDVMLRDDVPTAPADLVERIDAALAPFQRESDQRARPPALRAVAPVERSQDRWGAVNEAALAKLSVWVPDLIPAEYLKRSADGYRAKPFWRGVTDAHKVGIHPSGIKDHASDDRFTAIDLVTTIRKCLPGEARDWLAQRLGIDQTASEAAARFTPEFFQTSPAANDDRSGESAPKLFTRAGELTANPTPVQWLVTGLIEAETGGMLVADPGVGKTFLALGIAHAVATGRACYAHEVPTPGAVFYVAGEGHAGIKRRLAALEVHHGEPMGEAPLFISRKAVTVDNAESLGKLRDELAEHIAGGGEPVRLVVLDTLARCSAGEENSAQDASAFWRALDELRDEFKCAILVVHHTGHNEKGRARGSMAHAGAADFIHMLHRNGDGVLRLSCTKTKDSEEFAPLTFRLLRVQLPAAWGTTNDQPNSSCVVVPVADGVPDASKLTPKNRLALEIIEKGLGDQNAITKTEALRLLRESDRFERRRIGEAVNVLVAGGFFSARNDTLEKRTYTPGIAVWEANNPESSQQRRSPKSTAGT